VKERPGDGHIDIGFERIAYPTADLIHRKPLVCQRILMPQESDKRKGEASSKEKAVCAGATVLARLTAWILAGGPTLGIAFALIWGIQAAACAASSKGDHSGIAG
jgi:hypothetical protein